MNYRNLSPGEIATLKAQGNTADSWDSILVTDGFDPSRLTNNRFGGEVRIGNMDNNNSTTQQLNNSTPLPVGISGSWIIDSTIGDNCAIHNVHYLNGYTIANRVTLFNIDEMTYLADRKVWMEPMNENGGRRILPFPQMTVGDAYLWARFRGERVMVKRLEELTTAHLDTPEGCMGAVHDDVVIKNSKYICNVAFLQGAMAEQCIALRDGVVGIDCHLEHGIIAERFLLGEHVKLEFGLRLNDSVVGDNSTLARCEVGNSIIFPAHEQHHNNSFLIAALVMGQSNVAAGGTLGSNHNSRTADNELSCGRGFWPGLCVSVKHSSRFASNCLLAKADYPNELNITLPFALVNNNAAKNQHEVMPAYWWMYNMYAMDRNSKKFAKRDKRRIKAQHIEFDNLAPDTAEEIIIGRDLLHIWTEESYREGRTEVLAHGMEKGHRKTVILKPGEAYKAYRDMLIYYAMNTLSGCHADTPTNGETAPRVTRWVNIGGQLVAEDDIQRLISDIENGTLSSWEDIHGRFDQLWESYPEQKRQHAYQVLCHLSQMKNLTDEEWARYESEYSRIKQFVADQKVLTRKKDDDNEFRHMTYWNDAEMHAVLD